MGNKPYDYENRSGILPISWETFHGLCKGLAAAVAPWDPQVILPIGRAGYYPGTLIAHLLQREIYPIRLSRRVNDIVKYEQPQWLLEPPALVRGCRALVVDEISASGETINMAKEKILSLDAASVRSAVLYAHSWGVSIPDYIGFVSDALILNPWDREIWQDGSFIFSPEYVGALGQQGFQHDASLLIGSELIKPVKS